MMSQAPMSGMLGQGDVLKMQAQLFRKLMNVVEKMENVKKSGYNSHQKYHYSTEQDLIDSVRQLLIDNKILILTDSETKEVVKIGKPDGKGGVKESLVTVVNTRHTFCDIETGYTYNIQSTGTGWDETDKGSFKAITGAMKYFISKNFLVPGEDDAESDGVTPKNTVVATPPPAAKGFSRLANSVNNATPTAKTEIAVPKGSYNTTITVNSGNPTATVTIPTLKTASGETTTNVTKPSFGKKIPVKNEPNFP